MDVLIREQAKDAAGQFVARLGPGSLSFIDNDTVCNCSGDEGCAIGEFGHADIVVQAQPGEGISRRSKDECQVSATREEISIFVQPTSCDCDAAILCQSIRGAINSGGMTVMKSHEGGVSSDAMRRDICSGKSEKYWRKK